MKVFNYIRVSTKEQNEARQIEAMKEYNKEHNITNAIELIEKASGNNIEGREQLQLLLKVIGEGDIVVIKSLDRLARSFKDLKYLWQTITDKGAIIEVIDLPILSQYKGNELLGSFINELIITVLSYVSEQEQQHRKQRQAEGIAIAKERGIYGRPRKEIPSNWEEEYTKWKQGKQNAKTTMENLNMPRTSFYRQVKEYEARNNIKININIEEAETNEE